MTLTFENEPSNLTSDSLPLSLTSGARAEHELTSAIAAPSDIASLASRARDYAAEAHSENTRRAYRGDWRDFSEWCISHGRTALPASADTLAAYLVDRAEQHKTSTLSRRLTAIGQAHRLAGCPSPTNAPAVRLVWSGIRRLKGTRREPKVATLTNDVRRMVASCGSGLRGCRDRALLLLGFGGCFRRSELVAFDAEDLRMGRDGVAVLVRRSKTDQEGAGATIGVPYGSRPQVCPVRALKAWLAASGIESGPLFRPVNRWGRLGPGRLTAQSVALIVKERAELAGLDPALYAGHSLRSGHATSAAAGGAEERTIMRQGRWKDVRTARGYIQEGTLWKDNSGSFLGL